MEKITDTARAVLVVVEGLNVRVVLTVRRTGKTVTVPVLSTITHDHVDLPHFDI